MFNFYYHTRFLIVSKQLPKTTAKTMGSTNDIVCVKTFKGIVTVYRNESGRKSQMVL